jgi:hypothetical protein
MITYDKFFRLSIKTLKFLGVWIEEDSPTLLNFVSIFYHLFITVISIIFQVMFLMNNDNLSIENLTTISALLPMYASVVVRIVFFVRNQKKLEKLMKLFYDCIEHEYWITKSGGMFLEKRSQRVMKIAIVQATMFAIVSVFSSLAGLVKREIPSKMWLPYDVDSFLPFAFTIAWQQSALIIPLIAAYIINVFPLLLMSSVAGMIEELAGRIEKIGVGTAKKKKKKVVKFKNLKEGVAGHSQAPEDKTNEIEEDKAVEELKKCIEIQLKIREIIEGINEIFGKAIWIQGLLSTMILCTTTYAMTLVGSIIFAHSTKIIVFMSSGHFNLIHHVLLLSPSDGLRDFDAMQLWK